MTRLSNILADIGARITALFRTDPDTYHARHRKGGYFSPYVDWAKAQALRVRVWLDENPDDTVVLEAVPAWNRPTLWTITDVGDAPRITYGRGSSHYRDLKPAKLNREAERLIRTVTFVDVTDEVFAVVMADA